MERDVLRTLPMRVLPTTILALSLLASCANSSEEEGSQSFESFPSVPRSGATQPFEVEPCYTVHLPYDMERIDVQGIDSYVARFESSSNLLLSDCGGWDTDYGIAPSAQKDVTLEGHDGVLYQYQGSFDHGDQIFEHILVLHLLRSGNGSAEEHLDISVYYQDESEEANALGILASVEDLWQ